MANEPYLRDLVRAVDKLTAEVHQANKYFKSVSEDMSLKQFEDLTPPPKGSVIQNFNGVTILNTLDFEEMENRHGND